MVDGSDQVVQTRRGARPGESTTDLIFIVLLAKVTKEVRSLISRSQYRIPLPYATNDILSAHLGVDSCEEDAEAAYADDVMHGYLHQDPFFIVDAIGFTANALVSSARMHGLEFNFGPRKTESRSLPSRPKRSCPTNGD